MPRQPRRSKIVEVSSLPEEGLWISPTGERIPVREHLLTIQDHAELFDLSPTEVSGVGIDGLRNVAVRLIDASWTRFRYLDGVWNFEVNDAKRKLELIRAVLADCGALEHETVSICQTAPFAEFTASVADLQSAGLPGEPGEHLNTWRFS